MKEKIAKVYSCDHCNKKLFRKHSMGLHEKICFNNPENHRPCLVCPQLTKVDYDLCQDHPYFGEIEMKVQIFKCSVKDIYLHTPRNEAKGNKFELGDHENQPMPKKW